MALATVNANLVRRAVFNYLTSMATGTSAGAGDPSAVYAAKSFFLNLAANKGNPDLQFVTFNATDAVAGDGQDLGIDAACKLYLAFVKKTATAVDSWFRILDDADNDSEVVGDVVVEIKLNAASDQALLWFPNGIDFADGVVVTFTTTPGDTATQSSAADAGNGFLVLGAA
jgi:hypothetical protein